MRPLLAILSHGHAGNPDRLRDVGAVSGDLVERDLTPGYMRACEAMLRDLDQDCIIVSDGTLRARQQRAIEYGRQWLRSNPAGLAVYVACHLNAGGAALQRPYTLVCHDERSGLGREVAEAVSGALSLVVGHAWRNVVAASNGHDWAAPFATIRHVYAGPSRMTAICYEPLFLDALAHRAYLDAEGLRTVGHALANGLMEAAKES